MVDKLVDTFIGWLERHQRTLNPALALTVRLGIVLLLALRLSATVLSPPLRAFGFALGLFLLLCCGIHFLMYKSGIVSQDAYYHPFRPLSTGSRVMLVASSLIIVLAVITFLFRSP